MNDNQVRVIQRLIQVECLLFIANAAQVGIVSLKSVHRPLVVFADEILIAPCIRRLVNVNVMVAIDQFRGDAAQKMRVPVIPIRDQRMTEEHYAHERTSSTRIADR